MSNLIQDNVQERFSHYLQNNGLKLTSERLVILKESLATEGHFEADDLLVILKQKGCKTSRATVYRTLEILALAGILRKVYLGGSAIQFEKAFGLPHHDHMVCQNCGARFEFESPELQKLKDELGHKHNFAVTDYGMQIFGLCANCAGAMK